LLGHDQSQNDTYFSLEWEFSSSTLMRMPKSGLSTWLIL
jgi:hypothetical protein